MATMLNFSRGVTVLRGDLAEAARRRRLVELMLSERGVHGADLDTVMSHRPLVAELGAQMAPDLAPGEA